MEILPTHTCFDDALELLSQLAVHGARAEQLQTFVLVHAICVAPDGELYVHAWLEQGSNVWQCGIVDGVRVYFAMPIERFVAERPIREQTRYSVDDALRENMRTGHYGPWVDRYRDPALLGDGPGERRVWRPA